MTTYNEVQDAHMALATGDDAGAGSGLTQWDNAKAAFIAGELIPPDILIGWDNDPPVYTQTEIGQMSSGMIKHSVTTGIKFGTWKSKHQFQTVQFIFWLMQTTGTPTTENTPAGYNTHALTIGATNIPDWHGIHFEREGIASNEIRLDLMGFLPSDLVINCGQAKDNRAATQEITIPYAYLNSSASDIAAQTPRPIGTTGSIQKDWNHAIIGNGAGVAPSGLTYNSNQLEVDVKDISIKLHRDYTFGRPVSGNFAEGLMGIFDYSVVLDVVPTGDLLYTVNKTKPESYAGDLDYIFSFPADATNDKITFTFDKMKVQKFSERNDWKQWLEGYSITLLPLDKTSSLTVTGIDNLDNTHFENP